LEEDPFFIQADIAVIRTMSRIAFGPLVQPIPLGRQFVPPQTEVLLTGWGLLGDVS
jgi:Trypsin